MRYSYLFLLVLLGGCTYDMAEYVQLSTFSCSGEKNIQITPNQGMDDDIYEATSQWLKGYLRSKGYQFTDPTEANVWVTIQHKVTSGAEDASEVERVKEVYEGEGSPSASGLYHHQLTIGIDDKLCPKDSLKIEVSLDTYSENFTDVLPELMESLEESVANTKGPRSSVTRRISRRI